MSRFPLAVILFTLLGRTAAVADDPAAPLAQPAPPKVITADGVTTSMTTVAALEEELEVLEAQRQAKNGYLKMAEVALKTAKSKKKLEWEFEHAQGQMEVCAGELKEVELKIKSARQRLDKMKAVLGEKARDKAVQAAVALMGVSGFGGIQLLAGVSELQQPNKAAIPVSRIAVFNMAAVMKDYTKAKYQVYLLNEDRKKLSTEVFALKGDYTKIQQDIQLQRDPALKDQMTRQLTEIGRRIEDKSKDIDKQLNEKATKVISDLYDEIKSVVDRTAEMNGYHIVFAYPDATGAEVTSAYVKELKLKPPAAQPFYVAKQVDITPVVVQALNAWYPSQPPPTQAAPPPPGPTASPGAPPAPGPGLVRP